MKKLLIILSLLFLVACNEKESLIYLNSLPVENISEINMLSDDINVKSYFHATGANILTLNAAFQRVGFNALFSNNETDIALDLSTPTPRDILINVSGIYQIVAHGFITSTQDMALPLNPYVQVNLNAGINTLTDNGIVNGGITVPLSMADNTILAATKFTASFQYTVTGYFSNVAGLVNSGINFTSRLNDNYNTALSVAVNGTTQVQIIDLQVTRF